MQLDYKIAGIVQDGKTTVCKMRVYKGAVTTENEIVLGKVAEPVTRYRRQSLLSEEVIEFEGSLSMEEIVKQLNLKLDEHCEEQKLKAIDSQKASNDPNGKDL